MGGTICCVFPDSKSPGCEILQVPILPQIMGADAAQCLLYILFQFITYFITMKDMESVKGRDKAIYRIR